MFVAMNRFKVKDGSEEIFERVWKDRDSSLAEVPGFVEFRLLRGAPDEAGGHTLFISQSLWQSEADFTAWTRSENFRKAHRSAGDTKADYVAPPQFEGFAVVEGA